MPHYITKEGLQKLIDEFNELKTVKRKEVIERIRTAKELGDLSENAEYSDAKEEQGWGEGRIRGLEDIILNASVIKASSNSNFVNVGSMFSGFKRKLYFPFARYFAFFAGLYLRRWAPRVIVVTGSSGKTTLIELLRASLGCRVRVAREANSTFGIPFMVMVNDEGVSSPTSNIISALL